jgi:hypothetical protein
MPLAVAEVSSTDALARRPGAEPRREIAGRRRLREGGRWCRWELWDARRGPAGHLRTGCGIAGSVSIDTASKGAAAAIMCGVGSIGG